MPNIRTSLHGRLVGLDHLDRLIVPAGLVSGLDGKAIAHPSPSTVALFDDFYGDVISDEWNSRKGSDGATLDWAVNAQVNGVVRGVTGAGASTMAVNGVQLDSALNWKANQGNLCMEARVNMALITSMALYIGFTDQVAALEMPINSASSGNTITTTATDAVGFLFDTANTAQNWFLVGVANDVDATVQVLSAAPALAAPVAATFATFRIEVGVTGIAKFYYNGNLIGLSMAGAVTPTIALTPVIAGFRRTTTITQVDVDYVHVSANRV